MTTSTLKRLPRLTNWRWVALAVGAWGIPIVVILAIYFSPRHLASPNTAVFGLIALGILVCAVCWPARSLLMLIALLPFQGLVLSKLWAWGLPVPLVKHLGAWKETLALGVVIAGVINMLATGERLDAVDRLALGFVTVAALYAALQPVIVSGSPSASNIRLLGFRETAGFVLLLFGARHAALGPDFAHRAARAVFVTAVIVALVGMFEVALSSTWNHFIVQTIRYPRYEIAVLNHYPLNQHDIRVYGTIGGTRVVQIGSVFLNQLSCAWYMILPFAIGLERIVRRQAATRVAVGTALIGGALLLTQTRSAILGALVVAFLAFQPAAGRGRHWRTQVAIGLAALAVVAVPASVASGLVERLQLSYRQSNQSTAGHIAGFWTGVDTIGSHPLGLGLGTGAGTGQRFSVQTDVIPENNYLEVGDELGIVPLAVFVALNVAVLVRLRRASRTRPELLVTAAWAAGVGLAVAAWFLQTWSDFAVAWTWWGIAGAMLGLAAQRAARAPQAARWTAWRPAAALQGAASSASR